MHRRRITIRISSAILAWHGEDFPRRTVSPISSWGHIVPNDLSLSGDWNGKMDV
jgi:hypothetical protein